MHRRTPRWSDRVLPDLPPEIREDFLVHAASELHRHAPWLALALFVNSLFALAAGAPEAHWIVRVLLPASMAIYCLVALWASRSDWQLDSKPWRARKFLRQAALSSMIGATMSTSWCVLSWLAAPVEARMHFPIILVMGGMAATYCFANVKIGAYVNLAIVLVPIALLMFASGQLPEIAAAIGLLIAGLFQVGMIRAHNRRVVDLLVLQKRAHRQANSDSLTGLANRRALWERAAEAASTDEPHRLVLIDIDHFKAINDGFGHQVGDEVLCEFAEIIAALAPPGVMPARIGGEEFALFGPVAALDTEVAIGLLRQIRAAAMPHGWSVTASIGVAHGPIAEEPEWDALYRAADSALYRAKREGRNRLALMEEKPAPRAAEAKEAAA